MNDQKPTAIRPPGEYQQDNSKRTGQTEPLSGTEARQGRRGMPVVIVLAVGLLLSVLAWSGVEWWAQTNEPPAEQTATPPAGATTPANPNQPPPSTP